MKKKIYKELSNEFLPAKRVTYGVADTLSADDSRHIRFKKQRQVRGFDDTEIWDLSLAIAKFALKRLKLLKKIDSRPVYLSSDDWQSVLNSILYSFEAKINGTEDSDLGRYKEGIFNFAKFFDDLWC